MGNKTHNAGIIGSALAGIKTAILGKSQEEIPIVKSPAMDSLDDLKYTPTKSQSGSLYGMKIRGFNNRKQTKKQKASRKGKYLCKKY